MGFQTPQLKLSELLSDVGKGLIQLPDFQRAYKWDDERIRALLVTVLRGHPMGALMLLDTGNEAIRFKPQALARVQADAEAEKRQLVAPDQLLLDGQQRMTSLFQALRGNGVVTTQDARGKDLTRRYFLDVELALGDASDQDAAIRSLPATGVLKTNFDRDTLLDVSTTEKQVIQGLMPATRLFDGTATQWLLKYAQSSDNLDERMDVFGKFNDAVVLQMQSYMIPAISLDKETTKEAVATVFEKVNSGGLQLNNFELLTAVFAGDAAYYEEHGDDFRLGEDWALTEAVCAQHRVHARVKNTDFLQAVLLLATRARRAKDVEMGKSKPTAISARGDDTLKLTLDEYLEWAPRVRDALNWVAQFYARQHIHVANRLPYQTQTVPLAVFRVILGDKIDTHSVAPRIIRWYWSGVLGELYGSSTETRFARDVEQVPDWALAGSTGADVREPLTIQDANFFESRLLSLRTNNSAGYKGIYALLMAKHIKDWRLDQQIDHAAYFDLQIDIHHIFPRAWCEKNGLNADLRESIINKTPLAKRTNIFLRGESPASYLPRLERDTNIPSEKIDEILRSHLIDPVALRAADFETFTKARRAELVRLVSAAIGKDVVLDVQRIDGVERGVEDPSRFEPEALELVDSDADVLSDPTIDDDQDELVGNTNRSI